MDIAELKRKTRKLKELEHRIRFGEAGYGKSPLIWNSFFDLSGKNQVKYPLENLLLINSNEYRVIAEEFLSAVYSLMFKELDTLDYSFTVFDKELLLKLDLPPYADAADVKRRFRELAKQYHPDMGGNSEKFVELMETYRCLVKK